MPDENQPYSVCCQMLSFQYSINKIQLNTSSDTKKKMYLHFLNKFESLKQINHGTLIYLCLVAPIPMQKLENSQMKKKKRAKQRALKSWFGSYSEVLINLQLRTKFQHRLSTENVVQVKKNKMSHQIVEIKKLTYRGLFFFICSFLITFC